MIVGSAANHTRRCEFGSIAKRLDEMTPLTGDGRGIYLYFLLFTCLRTEPVLSDEGSDTIFGGLVLDRAVNGHKAELGFKGRCAAG